MPPKPGTVESITEVLSQYGPWGYLMLGMLICGTVLMFCGLWECCFHRPKTQEDEPLPTHPTTVLIINQPEEETSRPPSYEELDQPPPYNTLFPNVVKVENTISDEVISDESQNIQNNDEDGEGAVAVTTAAVVVAESSGSGENAGASARFKEDGVSENRTHQDD